ncbi:transcriptional regulator, LuxR family [Denitrovibrio acetiphilus DSM 12809]|uniref:Transcriptional regulator, LuxR family n=1 Tax=Denitrovibrio acetiphilus (strain DSM 12809 / NBRC 114555 / N2460) TaxID=522772 RepID=D4H7P9_DENA2|nr:helix-turn-helix transcriptional regulator [Denitrovibrio acetiphilus]ADD68048.1 transcriptional regulator, LuxR family [Denitrovibrio acetiphilus DSM 12809]
MYELSKTDYKAVLDLVTTLVNVKSISAFAEMLINSKELLGFDSVVMAELQFHKTCTHKIIYSDNAFMQRTDDYVVPMEDYAADKVFPQILAGKEVIKVTNSPVYVHDVIFQHAGNAGSKPCENEDRYILAKMNHETQIASLIVFVVNAKESEGKFEQIACYLHAHLLTNYVRILSVSNENIIKLSGREKSVLTWLKYGKTSWEVAKILNITENTVNFHIKNIKNKLNATNRQHAVAIAIAKSIIS